MDPKKTGRVRDGLLGLALASLCLAQCGCLLALAGAGAGMGAYAYHKGQSKGCFRSDFATAWHATRQSLMALGMPLTDERYAGLKGTIESVTGDGRRVVVKLSSSGAPIPSDGFRTEVSVRVGTFGDEAVGERLLTEIGMRLNPPGRDVIVPAPAGPVGSSAVGSPAVPRSDAPVERLPSMPSVTAPPRPQGPPAVEAKPGAPLPPP